MLNELLITITNTFGSTQNPSEYEYTVPCKKLDFFPSYITTKEHAYLSFSLTYFIGDSFQNCNTMHSLKIYYILGPKHRSLKA